MKKNKLLKTLGCLAGISAIGSIVPAITTSCGNNGFIGEVLPDDVYEIDNTGVLKGFNEKFLKNPNKYKSCNTMLIPSNVKKIAGGAFWSGYDCTVYKSSTIPYFIKTLKFSSNKEQPSDNEEELFFGPACFAFNYFENIYLPDKFYIDNYSSIPFGFSQNLKHIYLNEEKQNKNEQEYYVCLNIAGECQVVNKISIDDEGNQQTTWAIGGLATGFIDFTKIPSITEIPDHAFEGCSCINGFKFSNNIKSFNSRSFDFCIGLDPDKLSFEDDNKDNGKIGWATNVGSNAKFLVKGEYDISDDKEKFEYTSHSGDDLVAGDIDFTKCNVKPCALNFTSVSSVIFNEQLTSFPESSHLGFLYGNKQLKSITFNYAENQQLKPSPTDFLANPNLKYIEFNGYSSIDDFKNNRFILNEDNKTCFDGIARGGKIKASNCGFSSQELLDYFKDNTQSDWNPFSDWQAID